MTERVGMIHTMYADEDAEALLNAFRIPCGHIHSSRNHHTLFPYLEGIGDYLLCMFKFDDNPNSSSYTVEIRFRGEEDTLNDKIRKISDHHEAIFARARENQRQTRGSPALDAIQNNKDDWARGGEHPAEWK